MAHCLWIFYSSPIINSLSFLLLLLHWFPFQVLTGQAQGTTYTIKYVADQPLIREQELDSLFQDINFSMSLYEPSSLINTFNREGRIKMDQHFKKVVEAALDVYHQSGGAFDITSYSITQLWGLGAGGQFRVPSKHSIRASLAITGSNWLTLKGDSLIAAREGVKIDLNGIAQGYTVDVLVSFLKSKGITQMLVELGGEIRVIGAHPESGVWKIGLESAAPTVGKWYPVDRIIAISEGALTSSGGTRKSYRVGKNRYTHIIDPVKGSPVKNNLLTVTVQAPTTMMADAWDHTFLVMGWKKSKRWLLQQQDLIAWITYQKKGRKVQTWTNKK